MQCHRPPKLSPLPLVLAERSDTDTYLGKATESPKCKKPCHQQKYCMIEWVCADTLTHEKLRADQRLWSDAIVVCLGSWLHINNVYIVTLLLHMWTIILWTSRGTKIKWYLSCWQRPPWAESPLKWRILDPQLNPWRFQLCWPVGDLVSHTHSQTHANRTWWGLKMHAEKQIWWLM